MGARYSRLLPWMVVAIVLLVYVPSLEGGWVWDDHWLLEGGGGSFAEVVTRDVWGGAGAGRSNTYRPLTILLQWGLQNFRDGPFPQRALSLGMHLGVVWMVGSLSEALGARRSWAWLGALLFGLHPGVSEGVAWITGRHDLLPAFLCLGGIWALARGASGTAAFFFGLCPFSKEPYVLIAAVPLAWSLGVGRFQVGAFLGALGGAIGYLVLRAALGMPLPPAVGTDWIEAVGAVGNRGVELLLVPATADALPVYHPSATGYCWVMAGGLCWAASWKRPWLALLAASLVLLLPSAPASALTGLVADRYFYLTYSILGAGLGLALSWLEERLAGPEAPMAGRALQMLWLLLLVLAPITWTRAQQWSDDRSLFSASLRLDPSNPHAAFHIAYLLHQQDHNCVAAIPLYQQALEVESRAVTNLQACLIDLGRPEQALQLIPKLDPSNVNGALNTARAYALLGRWTEAREWVEKASALDASRASDLKARLEKLSGGGAGP